MEESLIQTIDELGSSPFQRAMSTQHQILIELMLELEEPPADEEVPVIRACKEDDIETLRALLLAGADLNDTDSRGLAPLHLAVLVNSKEMVEMLVEYGADPRQAAPFADNLTPLEIAQLLEHDDIAEIMTLNSSLIFV